MMDYILPFVGLCIGILACHDPLMNQLDRVIDQITKDWN